jgi:plastocyanin
MKFLKILAATALVVAASCGGDGGTSYGGTTGPTGGTTGGTQTGGGTNPVQTNAVGVGDDFFNPANIQVAVGTTVTWTWAATAVTHNVTFNDGVASGDKGAGANYSRTFSTAGTYNYHCTIHPTMTGSVLVQ